MKKILVILALCVMALTIGCESDEPKQHAVLRELDGGTINFADLKGKWVVINYWATWCHPCAAEIPAINAFYQKYKTQNVVVLGVNYDNVETDELKRIIMQAGITYPNLIVDPRQALGLGDIPGLPATYIFGPDGQLKDKLFGQQTQQSLQKAINLG